MDQATISSFLARLSDIDGTHPFSEAKVRRLDDPSAVVLIDEGQELVAMGVYAGHRQADGSTHWAVETAVEPSLRFPTFERAVLEATLGSVPGPAVSVWSGRASQSRALEEIGFELVRRLHYLVLHRPIEPSGMTRPLALGEDEALVDANNDAFAGHREAGMLTIDDMRSLEAEPWFDRDGIRVVSDGPRIVGFCWTKVHPNGDGEIYRIGVVSDHQGRGLGEALVRDGFAHLFSRADVQRGSLWVDEANLRAMALYERLGMASERTNAEYAPAQ